MSKEWFGTWFDSPYYHILYKHRDEEEARAFLSKLALELDFQKGQKFLDLACGKGRHSIFLNSLGLDVVGADLSASNVRIASAFENERLHFVQKDMRRLDFHHDFDVVLNLFTSFGYFDTAEEHLQVFEGIRRTLKAGGKLVLDYLNPELVLRKLVSEEEKEIDGILFHIQREALNGYIVKNIHFEDKRHHYHFQEKVKAITKEVFEDWFKRAGFALQAVYGNYQLEPYDACCSERMIFVAQKAGN
jgi:SAM-dependent methyltransferase